MGFTKFTKNVLNVSALPDRVQNQASSLKLVFDQAGVDIKAALNALISELEAKVAAANIGADVASVTEKNVQGILTAFENEIANRYTKAETNNAILADTNELIADVKIDLATGLLTVTKKNGTKQTFETSTEAESYAVGGTGTRPGEDTDNAKYYAQIAKQVAGGDFVTVVEMEGYAQKKGLYPNYNETELKGEVIETETTLEAESVLKVHGNSVQETRSGKNLFDMSATLLKTSGTSAINGEDSIKVIASGTGAYAWAMYPIPNSEQLLGKTITFSAQMQASAQNVGCVLLTRVSSSGAVLSDVAKILGGSGSVTITMPSEFGVFNGVEATNFVFLLYANRAGTSVAGDYVTYTNVQLEEGSTATSYEPYGAMPSPEFESPIKSVSSKSDNLFDGIFELGSINGGSGSDQASSNHIRSKNFIAVDSNTYYSFSLIDGTKAQYVYEYDENYNYVLTSNKVVKNSFKTESTTKYIRFRPDSQLTDLNAKVMLNKGTTALPYQPYGYVPVEARVEGKNLALWEVGTFDQNTGVDTSSSTRARAKFNIVAGEEYVVNVPYARFRNLVIFNNDVLIGNYQNCTFNRKNDYFSFIPSMSGICKIVMSNTDGNTAIDINQYNGIIQIERGSSPTPYESYKLTTIDVPLGDIELRSTPDGTRDTFARVDGVWNKVSDIESVVFDGSETWYEGSFPIEGSVQYQYKISNAKASTPLICNRFVNKRQINGIIYGSTCNIYIDENYGFLSGQFKEWLANNPTEVVYQLATPAYTPITDPALISALDELEQLVLHKGYNRITVTGVNGVKAQLELEIAPTALLTNISETETGLNMPVPVVSETGDVLVKVPKAENQMTINPATGVVNVKGLTINGVSLDAYIRSIIG